MIYYTAFMLLYAADWGKMSNKIIDSPNQNSSDDEVAELSELLKQQVKSFEMDTGSTDNFINKDSNESVNVPNKRHRKLKYFIISFLVIISILILFVITPVGQRVVLNIMGSYLYTKFDPPVDSIEENNEPNEEVKPPVTVRNNEINLEHINILLLGIEAIEGAPHTDSMIVATINPEQKTLKLTSIMRDLYVAIPGHSNNKLNAAYGIGGIDLLDKTLEENLGITTDGFVMVNFESFKKIVDLVGGIELTLTANEAKYLNTNNYISDPANRNVHEGKQLMIGDQVLGYCRVRYVSTGTENNDYGRTQRQRIVLNAIFEKLRSKNVIEMGLLINKILNNVDISTNISKSDFNSYLNEGVKLNLKSIENYRIPSDGSFETPKVQIGSRKNQDVLLPKDWEKTKKEIHDFMYGNEESNQTDSSEDNTLTGTLKSEY